MKLPLSQYIVFCKPKLSSRAESKRPKWNNLDSLPVENFRVKAREILRDIEDQIDNTIDEEDTRQAVNKLEDYFANVDLHVDLNKKGATTNVVTP